MTAASSPPTRAASRRAASTARSASRTSPRTRSAAASAVSRSRLRGGDDLGLARAARRPASASCSSSSASWRASSASRSRSSAGQGLLQAGDPARRLGVVLIGGGLGGERGLELLIASQPGLDGGGGGAGGLGAVADALGGAPGRVGAPRKLLALGAARRQRLLGGLAALGNGLELGLQHAAALPDLGRHRLG